MDEYEQTITRRELLRLGIAVGVAAVWLPRSLLWGSNEQLLPATPSAILGPFYPVLKPLERDSDLTHIRGHRGQAKGQIIHVSGRVLTQRGEPVCNARVELWQANTFGRYNHPSDANPAPLDPDFQGYGVQVTDRDGRFRFTTIKPGPYPFDGTRIRTPHLHFDVTGRTDQRVTQLFFAGEPLNDQDFVLQSVPRNRDRLLAPILPAPAGEDPASQLVQWDIVLPRG
jgi:protocatechuate 3,4-dioxygenase, beta subunit